MNISEKRYNLIFHWFLVAIASTIVLREISTVLINLFIVFNIIFYKRINFNKEHVLLVLIISSPFLLDLIFFWNNDSLLLGIKHAEKRMTLLVFPLLIIGHYRILDINKIARAYVVVFLSILIILLIRYLIIFPDYFFKYLNGIDLFELGYHFSNSFDSHAPALNMHVCFASVLSLYLIFQNKKQYLFYGLIYGAFFFFLLYINTRIAIVNCIICSVLILVIEKLKENKNKRKIISRLLILISLLFLVFLLFVSIYPRLITKFSEDIFLKMEMVGRLDEVERPETIIHGSLVTRVSIWKCTLELAQDNLVYGLGASDAKDELVKYYEKTHQNYLSKFKFPVHNQYLDFLLKFGVLGLLTTLLFMFYIAYIGFKTNNSIIISFFVIFFTSNLTDDFLIRFDGIVFSGIWISIFTVIYLVGNNHFYKLNTNH